MFGNILDQVFNLWLFDRLVGHFAAQRLNLGSSSDQIEFPVQSSGVSRTTFSSCGLAAHASVLFSQPSKRALLILLPFQISSLLFSLGRPRWLKN